MPINPFSNEEHYYVVDLMVSLKTSEFVFGFINISHIPYEKLEEIFEDEITSERFLFDDIGGYIIEEKLYLKHKEFLDKEVGFTFDFSLFDYSVGLSSIEVSKSDKYYHKVLPPFFEKNS